MATSSQKPKTENVKAQRAREQLARLEGRGQELLLWHRDFYSDEEIITALEKAGFRWSERHQYWDLHQDSWL